MSKLSNQRAIYTFSAEDGTITVEIEHSGDFYRAANKLTDTIRDFSLGRDQRKKLLEQILNLVQICEADAIAQTILDYDLILTQVE